MLQVREIGSGPRLVLFHGAAAPEVGWEKQEALDERFTLLIPWRRGYGDSPPADQQDFDLDGADLLELLDKEPAHAAAYSYGAIGLVLAASQQPQLFRSLTLIEPPLFNLVAEDPAVQSLLRGLGRMMELGPEEAPPEVEGMLVLQRLSVERGFPPPPAMRPPHEAQIDYEGIRSAEFPVLVVSGDHHPGWERTCDAVAEKLGAERAAYPGSGHAPQRANGFNEGLRAFLAGHDPSP